LQGREWSESCIRTSMVPPVGPPGPSSCESQALSQRAAPSPSDRSPCSESSPRSALSIDQGVVSSASPGRLDSRDWVAKDATNRSAVSVTASRSSSWIESRWHYKEVGRCEPPFSPPPKSCGIDKGNLFRLPRPARTVIRAFLVAGILFLLNQLSPHEPLIQLCKWLVPAWAFRYSSLNRSHAAVWALRPHRDPEAEVEPPRP